MSNKVVLKLTCIPARKVLLAAVFIFFSISLFAQTDTIVPVDKDTEKILRKIDIRELTRHGFNFWQDDFSGNWAGFDFGFNLFLNPDYTGYTFDFMENDVFRSNSTYINLIQQSFGLQRNRNTVGLVTGIGLHLESYRLGGNVTLQRLENDKIEPRILEFDQNQKSKLSLISLYVPLLAEFQVPLNHYENRIHFSGGLYGSLRVSSQTKIKYRVDRKKEKLKTSDHYSLSDFKYGLMVRAGYRWFNVFATYEPSPFFKEEKGPDLTPVTFGVTLISF
jgi:hypothetical protein